MTATHFLAVGSLTLALVLPSEQSRGTVQLEAADCSRYSNNWNDNQVAYAQQHAMVPLSSGVLQVDPGGNGGVKIEKGAGSAYSITACISAGGATREDAQRAADAVQLSTVGNRVTVTTPSDLRRWNVQLIVEAPAGAQIQAETRNGPIGINGVEGRISALATNGPISIRDVAGQVYARAQNGPISVSGSRGDFDVETHNGPISVDLQGSSWEGKLDARAKNGPLSVRVPSGFTSGVEITSDGRSPWSCHGVPCGNQGYDRGWNNTPRTVKIGNDPVVVRISTVNGPVSIDNR
jgi:hypothetical protein